MNVMKQSLFAIVFTFALFQGAIAQTDQEITSIDEASRNIRNNLTNLQKIEKPKNSEGSTSVYVGDNEIKLIVVSENDAEMIKTVEWYFSKGELIYSEQKWIDAKTGKIFDFEKFYLVKGHLINWQKSDSPVNAKSTEFEDMETQLIMYATKLKKENG